MVLHLVNHSSRRRRLSRSGGILLPFCLPFAPCQVLFDVVPTVKNSVTHSPETNQFGFSFAMQRYAVGDPGNEAERDNFALMPPGFVDAGFVAHKPPLVQNANTGLPPHKTAGKFQNWRPDLVGPRRVAFLFLKSSLRYFRRQFVPSSADLSKGLFAHLFFPPEREFLGLLFFPFVSNLNVL